ncbi:hypothetical protein EI94DRAFT_1744561 [Lactarius quietus]|nr:hypothetical protein EI94DRAFT_1744561 [Lactarius quietus]
MCWDLGAEESSKRTRRAPATRSQHSDIKCIHDTTKQSREAHPITAQLHLHPWLGHSASQVPATMGSPEQEQYEEIAQWGMQRESHNMQHLRTLTKRQRSMLQTDVAHGVIKCKLCPAVVLGCLQSFRRHCDTSEDHPAELTFCDQCGDYFGRRDSKRRHKRKRHQEECRTTPPDLAEWKKTAVEWLFDCFNAKMEHCLRTGEEIGTRFAVVIAQAGVPTTSKKGRSGGNT